MGNGRLPGPSQSHMALHTLAAELRAVEEMAGSGPVALSWLIERLEHRGHALIVLLLAVPFVLPFPTLGLSAPVGLALAFAGAALLVGRPLALPAFLHRREVPAGGLRPFVRGALRVAPAAARLLRPRLGVMFAPGMRNLLGLSLACSALILALPLPLPLGNFLPASAILLLAAGLMEGDGLFVLAGHAANAAVCCVLYLSWELAWRAVQAMVRLIRDRHLVRAGLRARPQVLDPQRVRPRRERVEVHVPRLLARVALEEGVARPEPQLPHGAAGGVERDREPVGRRAPVDRGLHGTRHRDRVGDGPGGRDGVVPPWLDGRAEKSPLATTARVAGPPPGAAGGAPPPPQAREAAASRNGSTRILIPPILDLSATDRGHEDELVAVVEDGVEAARSGG